MKKLRLKKLMLLFLLVNIGCVKNASNDDKLIDLIFQKVSNEIKECNINDLYIRDSLRIKLIFKYIKEDLRIKDIKFGDSICYYRKIDSLGGIYSYLKVMGESIPMEMITISMEKNGKDNNIYFSPEDITFTGDTLLDINADGKFEYIRKSYPSTGSWLAFQESIYVLGDGVEYKNSINLTNPTYNKFIKNGVITLSYDRPGKSKLVYMQFDNKFKIDTLLSLSKCKDKYMLKDFYTEKVKKLETIPFPFTSVKEEYLKWFDSKIEDE
jgi:hypothetical protein